MNLGWRLVLGIGFILDLIDEKRLFYWWAEGSRGKRVILREPVGTGLITKAGETMANRSTDWNLGLARDLKNPKFARDFIQAALEEGLPLQVVLGKVVRAYGVKEFGAKVGLPSSNLVRAINPKHNPTLATLNRILAPFALEIVAGPISKRRVA